MVQVAGWQPLQRAGKGGVGGFPTGVPLPQVPVSSKAEAEMVGSHKRRLLDVGITNKRPKKSVSRVGASGERSR